jgi:hypothetical protein
VQYPRRHDAAFRSQLFSLRADKSYVPTTLIAYFCSATIIVLLLTAANHNRKTGWRRKRADPIEPLGWTWNSLYDVSLQAAGSSPEEMSRSLAALNTALTADLTPERGAHAKPSVPDRGNVAPPVVSELR